MNAVDRVKVEHAVVSREEWLAARKQLLIKEKELTHLHDRLCAERRELPWVRVEKRYVFEGANGKVTLADLFDGRGQLIVQHFMFGPGWQEGCVGCSFLADHIESTLVHIEHNDVSFVAVSRAPFPEIEAFRQRMGWRFRWVSSNGSDFNYDYQVSCRKEDVAQGKAYYNYEVCESEMEELPGTSVFYKDASGTIFHTYSAYARGDEPVIATYALLDMTPKGRNEIGPNFNLTDWVRHHDRYGDEGLVDSTGRFVAAQSADSCSCSEKTGAIT
jgi:predicted dithiol-disulfide oxidoreductase (DUF899 family)